jgi:hypothetical protein
MNGRRVTKSREASGTTSASFAAALRAKRRTYRDLIERNRCEFLGLTAGTGGRQNLQFSCKLSFSESLQLIFHQFSDFRKP